MIKVTRHKSQLYHFRQLLTAAPNHLQSTTDLLMNAVRDGECNQITTIQGKGKHSNENDNFHSVNFVKAVDIQSCFHREQSRVLFHCL